MLADLLSILTCESQPKEAYSFWLGSLDFCQMFHSTPCCLAVVAWYWELPLSADLIIWCSIFVGEPWGAISSCPLQSKIPSPPASTELFNQCNDLRVCRSSGRNQASYYKQKEKERKNTELLWRMQCLCFWDYPGISQVLHRSKIPSMLKCSVCLLLLCLDLEPGFESLFWKAFALISDKGIACHTLQRNNSQPLVSTNLQLISRRPCTFAGSRGRAWAS